MPGSKKVHGNNRKLKITQKIRDLESVLIKEWRRKWRDRIIKKGRRKGEKCRQDKAHTGNKYNQYRLTCYFILSEMLVISLRVLGLTLCSSANTTVTYTTDAPRRQIPNQQLINRVVPQSARSLDPWVYWFSKRCFPSIPSLLVCYGP